MAETLYPKPEIFFIHFSNRLSWTRVILANDETATFIAKTLQATVPDIVGMPQADAESAITAAELVVGTMEKAYDDSVPEGKVISQIPDGGVQTDMGSSVDIIISLGVEQFTVPNVVGLTQADAESAITAADFVVGTVETAYDISVPEGSVISQLPEGGKQADIGSSVDLVISLGIGETE